MATPLERIVHPTLELVWYRWKFSSHEHTSGFVHGMFTRVGGVSQGVVASLNLGSTVGDNPAAVRENHRRLFAALGHSGSWVSPHQVHGNRVAVVGRKDTGRVIEATDALITRETQVPLLLRFADCVPVIFYDPGQRATAVAHAGWRGIVAGVIPATVAALAAHFGTRAQDLWAGIGPAIGSDHYQVGEDVAQAVTAGLPERPSPPVAVQRSSGWYLDLPRAVEAQLRGVGVINVDQAGLCTACNTGEWFSHRAEAGATGRFGVVAMLT